MFKGGTGWHFYRSASYVVTQLLLTHRNGLIRQVGSAKYKFTINSRDANCTLCANYRARVSLFYLCLFPFVGDVKTLARKQLLVKQLDKCERRCDSVI